MQKKQFEWLILRCFSWIYLRLQDEIINNCEQLRDIESTKLNIDTNLLDKYTGVDDNDEVLDLLDHNGSAVFTNNKVWMVLHLHSCSI